MDNEFMCITLTCEGDYVVPRNPPGSSKYPDVIGPNQACTLYGATPGQNTVNGAAYAAAGYTLNVHDLCTWWDPSSPARCLWVHQAWDHDHLDGHERCREDDHS